MEGGACCLHPVKSAMPPVEGPPAEEKKNVVGFIYPPPEVRSILLSGVGEAAQQAVTAAWRLLVAVVMVAVAKSYLKCCLDKVFS